MMHLYICQICGEPQLAEEPLTDCQFCGSPQEYLIEQDLDPVWGHELTDQEKTDVETTLELEVGATAYYLDVAKANEKYKKYERFFKALARVEKEHAEIAAKILGIDLPEFTGEKSKGSIKADLEHTKELETNAMGMYKEFMERATSQKLKKFYSALIHAENGHRMIAENELAQ